eukprot:1403224-Pyramimonas_sp.AAC.1
MPERGSGRAAHGCRHLARCPLLPVVPCWCSRRSCIWRPSAACRTARPALSGGSVVPGAGEAEVFVEAAVGHGGPASYVLQVRHGARTA